MQGISGMKRDLLHLSKDRPGWVPCETKKGSESRALGPPIVFVTISVLSHIFFLVSVVHRPYFHFTPLHEEVDLYLLAFPSCSNPFIVPL